MREISWQIRIVARVPDGFPQSDEPTNLTLEMEVSKPVYDELRRNNPTAEISVIVRSERLDK